MKKSAADAGPARSRGTNRSGRRQDLTPDDIATRRFLQEAKAARLDHLNVCTIHQINETEDGQL